MNPLQLTTPYPDTQAVPEITVGRLAIFQAMTDYLGACMVKLPTSSKPQSVKFIQLKIHQAITDVTSSLEDQT